MEVDGVKRAIGNTPLIEVVLNNDVHFWAKIEGLNPFGSMKDRATSYLVENLVKNKIIDKNSTLIESSSGNFGIALSAIGKLHDLRVICVVDPNITEMNKKIMMQYGSKLIFVNEKDENGSYQKSRIEFVKNYLNTHKNIYWTNQYNNPIICDAYFDLAKEIVNQMPTVDCIFVPVGTCGTISGISRYIKAYNPKIKIIAVDIEGSKIFINSSGSRKYPGMGSSFVPGNLASALIDDIVFVSNDECKDFCQYLLGQGVLAGASSGATAAAISQYCNEHSFSGNIVAIFPDRGDRYFNTLYI